MTINDRIKEYRKKEGFNVKPFASIVGISQGTLSDIENAKSNPSSETLELLVRNTDINPTWLLTGKGPMERESSDLVQPPALIAEERAIYNDKELSEINDILRNDMPEAKGAILKLLKTRKLLKEGVKDLLEFDKPLKEEG